MATLKFFLGTDSAPHLQERKETGCGCAGCYSAPAAIELYAEIFEQHGALDKLQGFASEFGADFYGLPRNTGVITLKREPWQVPERLALLGGGLWGCPTEPARCCSGASLAAVE